MADSETGRPTADRRPDRAAEDRAAAEEQRLARERRRFARRQWARRWRVWRWLVLLVLLGAAVATTIWLVFFSSVLAVTGATVSGTGQLSREEVLDAAQVPVGEPLARVDLDAVRRRVQALAPVRTAEVTRAWPDQLAIVITERSPVAVVQVGTRYRATDRDGVLFRDYQARPRGLPLIVATESTEPEVLSEAAAVAAALPPEISRRVDHLVVRTADDIRLELRDGRVVIWGSSEQSDLKAEVLPTLLARPGRTYDVSVPGQPTISQTLR